MKLIPPEADYHAAFTRECAVTYPDIDAFERATGYALDRARLESAARVLACPVKAHPPNWQHGRVLYALARKYLAALRLWPVQVLDIGTAKGFSALCLQWALQDAGVSESLGSVVSVDVIAPESHARRNTVAECDGLKTLAEILAPWPDAQAIHFLHDTGIDYLSRSTDRIHIAYIDGKHTYDVVAREGVLLSTRQEVGDLAIFDDVQIDGVSQAVRALADRYLFDRLEVLPTRAYAIGWRR